MSEKTNRLLEQASELVSLDEFDEALNIYTKILKINPNNIGCLLYTSDAADE